VALNGRPRRRTRLVYDALFTDGSIDISLGAEANILDVDLGYDVRMEPGL
jgi:hypothetical protein